MLNLLIENLKNKLENIFTKYFGEYKNYLWFWIVIGIIIVYILFTTAQNMIVIIGGFFLGLYLNNLFNKNKNSF